MEAFATITVFSQRKMSLHCMHRDKVYEIVLNSEYHEKKSIMGNKKETRVILYFMERK